MEPSALLQPVFTLAAWTVVMLLWMLATRIPAMASAGIDAQEARDTARLIDMLPTEITRISNNYNHLFEQPTLFYAVVITLAVLDLQDTIHVACAWAFVAIRIAHSLVQATVDIVNIRFALFALSWLVLIVMIVRGALGAF
ncbi:MAG: MAPEG family protein [Myxococcota bacterium]